MTKKKPDFSLTVASLQLVFVFLAIIGDAVVLIGTRIFSLFRKASSITLRIVIRIVPRIRLMLTRLRHIISQLFWRVAKLLPGFKNRILTIIKKTSRAISTASAKKARQALFTLKQVLPPRISLPRVRLPRPSLPRFHLHLPHPPGVVIGLVLGSLFTFMFIFIPYYIYIFIKFLPHPRLLSQRVIPVTTQIFDRHGTLLYEIHGDEDRKPIQLADTPKVVKQATIAIEDKDFYTHPGFSIAGIARAARENWVNHHELQGGSTLTQQLIKNSLLTPEISYWRKAREVVLAFWAERLYTKDQILEMYLNQVPYGGTAWGIEAAAETYFGKKVKDMTLAEAAYLAGLPAAPTYYSPFGSQPGLAKKRQVEVLRLMVEQGFITHEEAETARQETITVKIPVTPIKAPHFVMYIRELLDKKLGPRLVDQGGLRITTTLDLPLQERIQEIVTSEVSELAPLKVGNAAAVVTNPKTGEILAMVGSKDYFNQAEDGNVNVALSPRQPGSSIKAVTYTAALENGLTAASIIDDSPISYPIPDQPTYTPINYDGRFHGKVTLRSAFANSYNVPAVKTLHKIGVGTMLDMGTRMGITTWNDRSRFGLALTLGGGEVTLLDMATVYGVLANGGNRVDLDPFVKISDYTGKVYNDKEVASPVRVISEEIAFILSDILSDNRARTPAFGVSSSLVIPGKTVSVKTGTTNDKRDNWTIGYTPSIVVGVWVGNNDNTPMDPVLTSGVTGAAPIWNIIMSEQLKDKPNESLTPPPNIISRPCFGRVEYFVRGTEKGGCRLPSPAPSANPSA